ncbi:MAG: hypothetical protein HVN35_03350 [Methanobacteriaceae archaeon]|nr:hypothetical protein [Methanobacteriaceae archaeon]
MKTSSELIKIIFGSWFLILTSSWYLKDPSFTYYIPLIFFFLINLIIDVFKLKAYYNKNLFLFFGVVFLVLMGLSLILLSPTVDKLLYYIEVGIFTLLIILFIRSALKKIGNTQKK